MAEGLSSDAAIRKLRDAIDVEVKRCGGEVSSSDSLYYAFLHRFPTATCWILFGSSFLALTTFIFAPMFVDGEDRIVVAAAALSLVLCGTFLLNFYFVYLRLTEMRRKANSIIRNLDEMISDGVVALATPHLFEPASESVTSQWTYRDGVLVNLPWMLLVEGDAILLRPGREIPCRCRTIANSSMPSSEFEPGQIYVPTEVHAEDSAGVESFAPLLCRVEATPAAAYVRACLSAAERPPSVTENEYGRIVHLYLERIAVPAVLGTALVLAIFYYFYLSNDATRWYDILILTPAAVVLPLTMPTLSLYTWTFVLLHTARFLARFTAVVNPTFPYEGAELFTEDNASPNSTRTIEDSQTPWPVYAKPCFRWSVYSRIIRLMWKLSKGDPSSLPLSANLVQTLGNVTSFSVVDRKGIMSWANPTPEKLFFLSRSHRRKQFIRGAFLSPKRHRHHSSSASLQRCVETGDGEPEQTGDGLHSKRESRHLTVKRRWSPQLETGPNGVGGHRIGVHQRNHRSPAAARAHAEVLDLSHDPSQSFVVHFDDPNWRAFSSNLKPLGLNILLNSCNLQAEYVRFIDHIHAVSAVVPRTLAVVNRRCLCYLAKGIGFHRTSCTDQFETQQTLAAYRKTPGELPLPGLTKHKTPLPNVFAVVVRDKATGRSQLMCQGTADLVAEACDYYWDGVDVRPLEKQHRKKISDFAQRHSITAYNVAFSYRPLFCDIDRSLSNVYIDWPTYPRRSSLDSVDSLLSPAKCTEGCAVSMDSVFMDEQLEGRAVESPSEVLDRLLKGQVFLGMASLQYQAKPDVVRLVDSLDKACIRFVHYSKENELRSRIFAEKCGLEAGWNCHISLGRESEVISAAGSNLGSQQLGRIIVHHATASAVRNALKRTATRENSRRRSVPHNFKVGIPTVHFKSAAATPIAENVPKLICASTEEAEVGNPEDQIEVTIQDRVDDDDAPDDNSTKDRLERVDRCSSVATMSCESVFDDPADQQLISSFRSKKERTPLLSDATSRASVVTNHSSSNQPLGLPPNRARLPKGIENVRPHLERVDNVPLLVPLFTDCYPSATVEMISIMQEYGEVVCVLGSASNYHNAEIFCRANASIGIEPLHPAVCVKKDGVTSSGLSATDLTTMISTLPCSVSIYSGEQINLLDLIAASRHLLLVLRTSWLFYLSASLATSGVQLMGQLLALPRPFTIDLLVWLVCVVIPALSGSLCASSQSENVLKTATPKNANWVSRNAVKKFLLGFALKFLPSAVFGLLLFKCSAALACVGVADLEKCRRPFNESIAVGESDAVAISSTGLAISRYLFTFVFVFYLCSVSAGFVHPRALYKDRLPFSNLTWSVIVVLLLVPQFLYTALRVGDLARRVDAVHGSDYVVPWKVYVCGLAAPLVVVPLNELLKRYELERYHRDQRRRRLSFGTKLGMNSPF